MKNVTVSVDEETYRLSRDRTTTHFEHEVVDQSVPGAARGTGLRPARDDAPHRAVGNRFVSGAIDSNTDRKMRVSAQKTEISGFMQDAA